MPIVADIPRRFDFVLLVSTVLLVAIGLAALFSVSLNVEQPRIERFYRQLVSFSIGALAMFFFIRFDYRHLRTYAWVFYGLGLGVLTGVLLIGTTFRGTTGWFTFFGTTFQPVELMKVLLVVVLARFFSATGSSETSWNVIGKSAAIMAGPIILVLFQPDLGSALVPLFTWLGMLAFLRLRWRRLVAIILALALIAVLGWFLLADYQRDRILTFLNPERDPFRSGYNVRQAIVAVGSGKLFGRGLGLGTQSQLNFLPTQDTDFIFSVIAEELGFLGATVVLGLFAVFFWRLIRGLKFVGEGFGAFLLAGFLVLFSIQVIINISGNLGLLPVTGIPLPFLSFGGSALVSGLIAVGIALNVMMRAATYR